MRVGALISSVRHEDSVVDALPSGAEPKRKYCVDDTVEGLYSVPASRTSEVTVRGRRRRRRRRTIADGMLLGDSGPN